MIALAILPPVAIAVFTMDHLRTDLRRGNVQRLQFDTLSRAAALETFLQDVREDVHFLGTTRIARDLVPVYAASGSEPEADLRAKAAEELLKFFQGRRTCCQVRCLARTGEELVRLEGETGICRLEKPRRGQPDGSDASLQAALSLRPGSVGQYPVAAREETPSSPDPETVVLRYATPIADGSGRCAALFVVSMCAGHMLMRIGALPPEVEAWLLDEDGRYLGYLGPSDETRARCAPDRQRLLSQDLSSDRASVLLGAPSGGQTLESEDAFLCSAPVRLGAGESALRWTLLLSHPRLPTEAPVRQLTGFLALVATLIAAVAGVIGTLFP